MARPTLKVRADNERAPGLQKELTLKRLKSITQTYEVSYTHSGIPNEIPANPKDCLGTIFERRKKLEPPLQSSCRLLLRSFRSSQPVFKLHPHRRRQDSKASSPQRSPLRGRGGAGACGNPRKRSLKGLARRQSRQSCARRAALCLSGPRGSASPTPPHVRPHAGSALLFAEPWGASRRVIPPLSARLGPPRASPQPARPSGRAKQRSRRRARRAASPRPARRARSPQPPPRPRAAPHPRPFDGKARARAGTSGARPASPRAALTAAAPGRRGAVGELG